MAKIRQEKTGEFKAVDNKGNFYTIVKYTDFHDAGTLSDPDAEVQGLDSYRLPDGEPVNKISDTEFFTVVNEVTLRSV